MIPKTSTTVSPALALQLIETINKLFECTMPLLMDYLASQTSAHALHHLGEAHTAVQVARIFQQEAGQEWDDATRPGV